MAVMVEADLHASVTEVAPERALYRMLSYLRWGLDATMREAWREYFLPRRLRVRLQALIRKSLPWNSRQGRRRWPPLHLESESGLTQSSGVARLLLLTLVDMWFVEVLHRVLLGGLCRVRMAITATVSEELLESF